MRGVTVVPRASRTATARSANSAPRRSCSTRQERFLLVTADRSVHCVVGRCAVAQSGYGRSISVTAARCATIWLPVFLPSAPISMFPFAGIGVAVTAGRGGSRARARQRLRLFRFAGSAPVGQNVNIGFQPTPPIMLRPPRRPAAVAAAKIHDPPPVPGARR